MITQATEHPAVLRTCRALERLHGARITVPPVSGEGLVDPAALEEALTSETVLVAVMAANTDTGALQPVTELPALARERGTLFHCDAAQTAGVSGPARHQAPAAATNSRGHTPLAAPDKCGLPACSAAVGASPKWRAAAAVLHAIRERIATPRRDAGRRSRRPGGPDEGGGRRST
ncbi:aminotransferase class V-fold PLP-dependent enzyme [Spirillospora sp. NPDC050365]